RERLETRLALKVSTVEEAVEKLAKYAQGEPVDQVLVENGLQKSAGIAFVYSGNGAQWLGMGRRLLAESSRFAHLISDLDTAIQPVAGFSILAELNADEASSRLDDTTIAQPTLFAIQVALTAWLREQGVEPTAVAGHSVGEVAAAWAVGALDLDQAIRVIVSRSRAQGLTRGTGRMAAVGLSEAAMKEVLAKLGGDVEIAGINSPGNVTVSGAWADLERVRRHLEPKGVFFRLLDLDYAFHSGKMDPVQGRLAECLAALTPRAAEAALFVSSVTGDVLEGTALGCDYWWRNVRQPVRFAQAVGKLIDLGCRVFIEIGPHAILQRYIGECLEAAGVVGRVLLTLRRNDDGIVRLEETALRTHLLAKGRLDVYFPERGRPVRLPNYPWQRERHWHPRTSEDYALIERRRVHPLLGWRLKEMDAAWENTLDPVTLPWLADHKVGGAVVLPGAAYAEMALAAAREWFGGGHFALEELNILGPVVFDGEHGYTLRFGISPHDGSFQIRSRQRLSEDEWALNAVGRLLRTTSILTANRIEDVPCDAPAIDRETHYRLASAVGLDYGPTFQGLESVRVRGEVLEATLALPQACQEDARYLLHPAVLDTCFQSLVDFFRADIEAGQGVPLLPVKLGRLDYYRKAPVSRVKARLVRRGPRSLLADFALEEADGQIVATVSGCRFRVAPILRRERSQPICWRTEPWLQPHPAEQRSTQLPATADLAKGLRDWFAGEETRLSRAAYFREMLPLFEALAVSFAYGGFQALFANRADWLQRALAEPASVDARVRPFFLWLAGVLQQEGLLVVQDGAWRLEQSSIPPAEAIWQSLLRDHPACLPELVPIGRIGRHLPTLLTGEMDVDVFMESLCRSPMGERRPDDAPAYLGTRL
ncbi:MAG: type I polyketide synthase WcbR, partial [Azospira oryzae]